MTNATLIRLARSDPDAGYRRHGRSPRGGALVPAGILRRLALLLLVAVLAVLAVAASIARAAPADAPAEQRVRAAMLFNFLKLTEWPATVGNELRLCVASDDASLVAATEALSGRAIMARRVQTLRFRGAATCDAIYVDSRRHWNHFLDAKPPRHALTVGGYAGFARDGGMIEVVVRDGSTRYSLNLAEAKRAALRFHPEMLRLAGPAGPIVWIALAEEDDAHAEAAAAIEAEIKRTATVITRPWQAFPGDLHAPAGLVVAVGSRALRGAIDSGSGAPVLAVLVSEAAYRSAFAATGQQSRGDGHSAVYMDQPPARQLAALQLAMPERRRIGILFGPESQHKAEAFGQAATERGMSLAAGHVSAPDRVAGILQKTIEDSDLLLAVADPAVYNNASVQHILTWAYRRRLPTIGFSPAYVRAGALLAIYSTPAQMGHQAGEIARAFMAGRPLPPPQAPRDFMIGINADVARSLAIPLKAEDGAALATQLQAMERERKP